MVSNTNVPVFISKKKTTGKKILLTTDGSEHSYSAIRQSIEMLDFSDKELHVMSVMENPELLPLEAALDKNWLENIEKQQRIHSAKAINRVKSLLEKNNLPVSTLS